MASGKKAKVKGKRKKTALVRAKKLAQRDRQDFTFQNPRDKKGAAAVELREKTLGVEFINRSKNNVFMDKRAGQDKGQTEEEKMWERLVRQRQQMAKQKGSIFDLNDDGEPSLSEEQSLGVKLFSTPEATESEATEGTMDDADANEPPKKKTRKEIMQEVMLKGKMAKLERHDEKEQERNDLNELDAAFNEIAALLKPSTPLGAFRLLGKSMNATSISPKPNEHSQEASKVAEPSHNPKKRVSFQLPDGGPPLPGGVQIADEGGGAEVHGLSADGSTMEEDIVEAVSRLVQASAPSAESDEGPTADDDADGYKPRLSFTDISKASFEDLEELFTRDDRGGRATKRTPTPQEVIEAARASLEKLTEAKSQRMKRASIADQDVDQEKPMEEEDEEILAQRQVDARSESSTEEMKDVLSKLLGDFEKQCKACVQVDTQHLDQISSHILQMSRVDKEGIAKALQTTLQRLYEGWQLNALQSKKESQRREVSGDDIFGAMFAKLLLLCYPSSDFRHPVCTPVALWLTASLAQDGIYTLHHLSLTLFRLCLVLEMLTETKRCCPEALLVLCNLLTLWFPSDQIVDNAAKKTKSGFDRKNPWLPDNVHELPIAAGLLYITPAECNSLPAATNAAFPATCSEDEGDLSDHTKVIPAISLKQSLFAPSAPAPLTKAQFIKAILRLVAFFHKLYCDHQSFPEMFAPLLSTLQNGIQWVPAVLQREAETLVARMQHTVNKIQHLRRPLAMQTHRPVPLKLYDPLIDIFAGNTQVKRSERTRKEVKQAYSTAMRQAVKAIRADTRYLQGARESEQAVDDERRTKKFNQLYNELQEQRHMVGQLDNKWQKKRERLQREKAVEAHVRAKAEREAKIKETKRQKQATRAAKGT